MKLYLYDFDGTIYDGDSSADFFKFCYKKGYIPLSHILKLPIKFLQYKTKYITITYFKEFLFSFFKNIDNVEELVLEFWELHKKNIKEFYLNKDRRHDIIISASPEFLLKPICDELKVKALIASDVNPKTGKFNKPNCRGVEKVKRLGIKYPNARIIEMYSDSFHDWPLLELAEKSYMVKKNEIYDYKTYMPNFFVRFWRWGWRIHAKNEEVWNYLIVGGLTTIVSIATYIFFDSVIGLHYQIANVISWIIAVTFAYFTNRWFVFHSRNKKLKEAIGFYGARIFTLLLEAGILFSLIDLIHLNSSLSKVLAQIVILVANYIISKLIIFKKRS